MEVALIKPLKILIWFKICPKVINIQKKMLLLHHLSIDIIRLQNLKVKDKKFWSKVLGKPS